MNEEKSMIEYKEKKGPFQWIKARFEKLKEKFRPKTDVKKKVEEGPGLTPEQLKVAEGGYPDTSVLDYDELEAKISNIEEPKSWDLTKEQQEDVEEGYEEIRKASNQTEQENLQPDQLTAEQLDKVTGYSKEYIDLHSNPQRNKTNNYLER